MADLAVLYAGDTLRLHFQYLKAVEQARLKRQRARKRHANRRRPKAEIIEAVRRSQAGRAARTAAC